MRVWPTMIVLDQFSKKKKSQKDIMTYTAF